ncbi:MAG: motility associated factor glycosyltransferase family protein [Leptospiraceae bacterium]|nr:motility associated factor glycosyltransferase family protein [Leptospiraceae bacterium]
MISFFKSLLLRKPYLKLYYNNMTDTKEQSIGSDHPSMNTATQRVSKSASREDLEWQPPQRTGNYSKEKARDGSDLLLLHTDAGHRPLASKYDPTREAQRLIPADAAQWTGTEIILILGLGNPAVLDALLPVLHDGQICLATDASLDAGMLLARSFESMWRYLDRPGCHLFCGDDSMEALRTYLESLPAERFKGIRIIQHSPSMKLDPDFYTRVETIVRNILRARMSDMLTRFEFEKVWVRNIIINSRLLPDRNDPHASVYTTRHWENVLQNVPGVVVAAGPSLRESLADLAYLKERAFLLACDTAARVMATAGILPHAIMTLDAQKHTLFHFQSDPIFKECLLFADLVTHPAVLRHIPHRALIFSTTARLIPTGDGALRREATPGSEHAELIHGPIGSIQSGGSVATSAFDLLRTLGCDPILLIGQDLAYTGRMIHSPGTHHTRRWLTTVHRTNSLSTIIQRIVHKRETMLTEGLAGRPVLTDYVLNLYRQWFEESIPGVRNSVFNLTRGGARIQGIERRTIEQLDLPLQTNLLARFANARPAHPVFRHTVNERLYSDLNRFLSEDDDSRQVELKQRAEKFFEHYPALRILSRRAGIYVRRNAARLSPERARGVYERYLLENLRELERSLRPYFAKT